MKWSDLLLPKPKYATHNLSKTVRGSLSPGLLYPVYHRIMLPGDKFKVDLRSLIRTDPTVFPLMGSFKVRVVTVVSNLKNYCIALEGYRKSFDWRSVTLPYFRFDFPSHIVPGDDDYDGNNYKYYIGSPGRLGVRETSLADYIGYERGWFPCSHQYYDDDNDIGGDLMRIRKSALPFLLYWDYYRTYMVNPQDVYAPLVVPSIASYEDTSGRADGVVTAFQWNKLDDLIEQVHKTYDGRTDIAMNDIMASVGTGKLLDWTSVPGYAHAKPNTYSVFHGGLFGTMYDPDFNTQWLSVANYDKFNEVTIDSTISGDKAVTSFQDIVKASSLYQFIMGEVYGDGTYSGHIYGQYGVSVKADMNIPQIVHVMDSRIDFENITSQSDTATVNSQDEVTSGAKLGQQSAVGRGFGQSGRFTISNSDYNLAMMMTFVWITPEVDYSTGLYQDSNITKLSDIYVPAFDNYSLQARFQEQVNSAPITVDANRGVNSDVAIDPFAPTAVPYSASYAGVRVLPADLPLGYQPAFTEYKTDANTVHGMFRNTMRDYTLLRTFPTVGLARVSQGYVSSYVFASFPNGELEFEDSCSYNQPFAFAREDHFFAQFRFNITAIRPISKSAIPHVK